MCCQLECLQFKTVADPPVVEREVFKFCVCVQNALGPEYGYSESDVAEICQPLQLQSGSVRGAVSKTALCKLYVSCGIEKLNKDLKHLGLGVDTHRFQRKKNVSQLELLQSTRRSVEEVSSELEVRGFALYLQLKLSL